MINMNSRQTLNKKAMIPKCDIYLLQKRCESKENSKYSTNTKFILWFLNLHHISHNIHFLFWVDIAKITPYTRHFDSNKLKMRHFLSI